MKRLQRPVLVNLFLIMTLIAIGALADNRRGSSQFFISGTAIIVLAAVNFLVGMVRNRNRTGDGQYYFLFAGVILLIGFSVCSLL